MRLTMTSWNDIIVDNDIMKVEQSIHNFLLEWTGQESILNE